MKPLNFIIFLFRKSFFSRVAVLHPAPFYLQKFGEKKIKEMEKLLKRKNKDNLPQKVYIKYFTKTDNFKVQDIRE
jgi:hypothetical protein